MGHFNFLFDSGTKFAVNLSGFTEMLSIEIKRK